MAKTKITAKVRLNTKPRPVEGQVSLSFYADYVDERNKEWAKYTPACAINMTVLESVAERFENGKAYTLTFEEDENNG